MECIIHAICIRVNSNCHKIKKNMNLFERWQKIELYREKCLAALEKWPSATQVQILITIPPLINLIESLTKSWLQTETKWSATDGIVSIKDVLKYLVTIDLKEKECWKYIMYSGAPLVVKKNPKIFNIERLYFSQILVWTCQLFLTMRKPTLNSLRTLFPTVATKLDIVLVKYWR